MGLGKATRVVGLAVAVIALLAPPIASGEELWWMDHKQGRLPVSTFKKVVEPYVSNLTLTNAGGTEIGPCEKVSIQGEIWSKFGGMGEGELTKTVGAPVNCKTTVKNCTVKKIEPTANPKWGITLKSNQKVVVSNFGLTIEWEGECEKTTLPKEFAITGTVEGSWFDFGKGEGENPGSEINFKKVEVTVEGTKLYIDGPLIFGTEVTAKPEPEGFTASTSPATLDGVQSLPFIFTRSGLSVECAKSTLEGTAKNGDTTFTVTPTYSSCSTAVGPATIKMNGCDFLLHLNAEVVEGEIYTYLAPTDLKCPAGTVVEIDVFTSEANHTSKAALCRYTLSETGNQGRETVELTNQGDTSKAIKGWIEPDVEIEGITSKRTFGFFCGPETDTTGTLEGSYVVTGTNGGKEVGIGVFPG
jgi:hypothetical protein